MKLRNISADVHFLPAPYLGRDVEPDEVVTVRDEYADPALYAWPESIWAVIDEAPPRRDNTPPGDSAPSGGKDD